MHHQAPGSPPEPAAAAAPPMGHFYRIGGRQLLLHRSGAGGPPVVFAPAAGLIGLDYLNVHDRAAELTTSVLYDRAGTGWSESAGLPRAAAVVVDELRDLLRAAGVPAPYLLVGHSLGGLYIRHYAQRFPGEVAGLLMLDPGHEDYPAHLPRQLLEMLEQAKTDQAPAEPDEDAALLYHSLYAQMFAQWPGPVRDVLVDYHLRSGEIGTQESANQDELYREIRAGADLPDVPLIVLTAMEIDSFHRLSVPEHLLRETNDGKLRLYQAFAESVPHGEQRVLSDARHNTIHIDRPDAVLQAIRDLLGRASRQARGARGSAHEGPA